MVKELMIDHVARIKDILGNSVSQEILDGVRSEGLEGSNPR